MEHACWVAAGSPLPSLRALPLSAPRCRPTLARWFRALARLALCAAGPRGLGFRSLVQRLIDTELAAAGQGQLRQDSPAAIHCCRARDVARLHLLDEVFDIVAHEKHFVRSAGGA